jgi:hypothetical protein
MALQTSGQITIDDLRTEFGVTGRRPLSDFYRGGGIVPDTPTNSGVPTSGRITLSDFYGAAAATPDSPAFSVYKTSDTSRTGTTLADDFDINITGIPAGTYIIEGFLPVRSDTTSNPGNMRISWTTPSLNNSYIVITGVGEKLTNPGSTFNMRSTVTGLLTTNFTGIDSINSSAVDNRVGYSIRGAMDTSASGSLILRWAQDTSELGNPTTLEDGAWLKLWEVT